MSYPWAFYRHQWTSLPPLPKNKSLAGRTIVISGGNSGVGLEAIKQLAQYSPARIVLAVRTIESGEKFAATLRKAHPKIEVDVWYLDLTKIESVKAFAEKAKELDRLDILMNNAGINPNFEPKPITKTEDGYERTIQTNVFATLLLTLLLEPLLSKTAQIKGAETPIVVFTGSDGHAYADHGLLVDSLSKGTSIVSDLNDSQKYDNGKRYFLSKLILQMVTRSLIPALPHLRIINANPGMSRSNLGRDFELKPSFALIRMAFWFMTNSRSAYSGAKNLTTAVLNSEDSVDYWSECAPVFSENPFLLTGKGIQSTKVVYKEFVDECEKIAPGSTANLIA